MQTLDEFNKQRSEKYINPKPIHNGIACPECGAELYDSANALMLMSNPPMVGVYCDCGFKGHRVA